LDRTCQGEDKHKSLEFGILSYFEAQFSKNAVIAKYKVRFGLELQLIKLYQLPLMIFIGYVINLFLTLIQLPFIALFNIGSTKEVLAQQFLDSFKSRFLLEISQPSHKILLYRNLLKIVNQH
jgi:hypothetical protein